MNTNRALYLCYFGLREPLVQTQVLPYLRELSRGGRVEVFLLTFEPDERRAWTQQARKEQREKLAAEGIRWHTLPYHKRPSALVTPFDILAGAWTAARLVRRHAITILHARGHIPMAMALLVRRWLAVRVLFDVRGLLADEYADAGVWAEGSLPFRIVRRLENVGMRAADQIVVLTRRLRDRLVERGLATADRIEVIPCCVDFARFEAAEEATREPESVAERFEVVTAGSVTGLYLLEEMARFFLALRAQRPDAFFRILTTSEPREAAGLLLRTGLRAEDFWIGAVSPAEVPARLRRAHLGVSFRKATFSQIAASPTKIPEYLAAGLPVVCNAGIGDMDALIRQERVGVILENFDAESYAAAAGAALALTAEIEIRARCVAAARRHFDLVRVGGHRYRSVYNRLESQPVGPAAVSQTV